MVGPWCVPLFLPRRDVFEQILPVAVRLLLYLGRLPWQYFVMWGEAEGGFFCPEPWVGGPDSLNSGKGIVVLQAGLFFV